MYTSEDLEQVNRIHTLLTLDPNADPTDVAQVSKIADYIAVQLVDQRIQTEESEQT